MLSAAHEQALIDDDGCIDGTIIQAMIESLSSMAGIEFTWRSKHHLWRCLQSRFLEGDSLLIDPIERVRLSHAQCSQPKIGGVAALCTYRSVEGQWGRRDLRNSRRQQLEGGYINQLGGLLLLLIVGVSPPAAAAAAAWSKWITMKSIVYYSDSLCDLNTTTRTPFCAMIPPVGFPCNGNYLRSRNIEKWIDFSSIDVFSVETFSSLKFQRQYDADDGGGGGGTKLVAINFTIGRMSNAEWAFRNRTPASSHDGLVMIWLVTLFGDHLGLDHPVVVV